MNYKGFFEDVELPYSSTAPFVVLVVTVAIENPDGSRRSEVTFHPFERLSDALSFKATRGNPDTRPETATVYQHSGGQWVKAPASAA